MTTEAPFTPPKRKPHIFWWIGGAFVVLFMIFVFQLLGPAPLINVSPQTTSIISPLRPDGTPNYTQYVLQMYREGVTPENNAAALLWPALWPGELSPPEYAYVARELGLPSIPSKSESVDPIFTYCRELVNVEAMKSQQPTGPSASDDPNRDRFVDIEKRTDELCDRVSRLPWTSSEFPDIAKWVDRNQAGLDLMVAASQRSRCYFPSPTLLNSNNALLVSYMLPGQQGARAAGRDLIVRAMRNIGEQQNAEAWRDLFAIHRLGRLVAQGPTVVEQLIGFALENIASDGTAVLLHEGHLSREEARHVMQDLDALSSFSGMADSLDHMERLMYLDMIIQFKQGNFELDKYTLKQIGLGDNVVYLRHLNVDWNVALRRGNQYFDRYAAAARTSDYAARHAGFQKIYNELNQSANNFGVGAAISSALNPSVRSDAIASIFLKMFLPAADAGLNAQERVNAKLELLRLGAALALFRAEHGDYPEKLDELAPAILPKLPVDFFNAKSYAYKRIGNGYLLYSFGPNGVDEGGSNEQNGVFEGYSLDEMTEGEATAARTKIPANADDLSLRVPHLPVKMSE